MGKLLSEKFGSSDVFTFIIPGFFFIFGIYSLLNFHKGSSVDSYVLIQSSKTILSDLTYTGLAAGKWPPLYPVLTSIFGLFLDLEISAKLISLISAFLLLVILPFLTKRLNYGLLSGCFLQLLLVINPSFLTVSLTAETHMLGSLLFLLAIYSGIKVFGKERMKEIPWFFIFFTVLACLTRYTSWVIIIAFLLVTFTTRQLRKNIFRNILTLTLILIPNCLWFIYNLSINGHVISDKKVGPGVIGFGMVLNNLFPFSMPEFVLSKHFTYFEYSSVIDLILTYPRKYLIHIFINIWKVIKLLSTNFPPLNILSFLVGVGFFVVIVKTNHDFFRFVFILCLLYFSLVILTAFQWVYLLPVSLLLSVLGLSYFLDTVLAFLRRNIGQIPSFVAIVLLSLPLMSYLIWDYHIQFRDLIDRNFRRSWTQKVVSGNIVDRVEKKLKPIREKNKHSRKTKIMLEKMLIPNLYKMGFTLTLTPVPELPAEKFFCYSTLNRDQFEYYKYLNYPTNLEKKDYVPPDYFVVTPLINLFHRSDSQRKLRKIAKFLRPTDFISNEDSIRVFEVKTSKLNCEP